MARCFSQWLMLGIWGSPFSQTQSGTGTSTTLCQRQIKPFGFHVTTLRSAWYKPKSLLTPWLDLLKYAGTEWDPTTLWDIARLEAVQHTAAHFILNRHRNTSSVGEILQSLNWPLLEQQRSTLRLAMLYKIDNRLAQVKCPKLNCQTTRATWNHRLSKGSLVEPTADWAYSSPGQYRSRMISSLRQLTSNNINRLLPLFYFFIPTFF